MIIDDVKAGLAVFDWATITSEHKGHTLTIHVFRDAMKLPAETPTGKRLVRRMVTAIDTQQVADYLFCMMMTPKMEDLVALQAAVSIMPMTRIDNDICANSKEWRHSDIVEQAIGGRTGLVNTVGKSWVLTNYLADPKPLPYGARTACNYGWVNRSEGHLAVTQPLHAWQPPAYRHNDEHKDPSQTLRLAYEVAKLEYPDGQTSHVLMSDIATDPVLSYLISHEGPMRVLRQPSVPAPMALKAMKDSGNAAMFPITLYPYPFSTKSSV